MRDKPTVFLSSTINDLKEDRAAIFNFIKEQMNFEIFASEKEGADWISSNEKCIEAMENADMMILVMGKRYGYIPTICEFPFDGNTSVTHAEYKIAL